MRIRLYIVMLTTLSLLSCNKWLNIEPQGQAEASKLLTTINGYNSALGGIYYTLSNKTLYGENMTYGAMDAMAQYWNISGNTSHQLYSISKFDYKASNSVNIINSIWKAYYSCITQCNIIIESLEKNRNEIENSALIEGEAYGLRAFCHMELFKLFGPVIRTKADLEKKAIAYRTKYDVTSLEFMTGTVVLQKAEQDLKKAMDLMVNDPINTFGRKGDGNTSILKHSAILEYRGARMNYYAALAMLTRLEILRLNKDEAYKYATQLIAAAEESKVFSLMDKANMESSQDFAKDLNYSREMIFSIYLNNWDNTETFFGMNGKTMNVNQGVSINPDLYLQIKDGLYFRAPDGSATDNRFRYWLKEKSNSAGNYDLVKYQKPADSGMTPPYNPEIAIFKLSEAYYIASEALIGKDNDKAVDYLNEVRRTRNLLDIQKPVADAALLDYLIREQRKDNFGDGFMFTLYKRLFAPIYVNSKISIEPLESNFVLPIPDSEYEFSPNPKPTE